MTAGTAAGTGVNVESRSLFLTDARSSNDVVIGLRGHHKIAETFTAFISFERSLRLSTNIYGVSFARMCLGD
jgi:hypothetical protein